MMERAVNNFTVDNTVDSGYSEGTPRDLHAAEP